MKFKYNGGKLKKLAVAKSSVCKSFAGPSKTEVKEEDYDPDYEDMFEVGQPKM